MSAIIIDRITKLEDVDTVGALQSSGSQGFMSGGSKNSVSFYVLLKEDKKLSSKEIGSLISKNTSDLDAK